MSNTFALEWPKGSGTVRNYPEIDDAKWAGEAEARTRLVSGQLPILDALMHHLESAAASDGRGSAGSRQRRRPLLARRRTAILG